MLKSAYLLAKIGADTAENERHFAKMFCQKFAAAPLHAQPAPGPAHPAEHAREARGGPAGPGKRQKN